MMKVTIATTQSPFNQPIAGRIVAGQPMPATKSATSAMRNQRLRKWASIACQFFEASLTGGVLFNIRARRRLPWLWGDLSAS
jgi:hypothetical protein